MRQVMGKAAMVLGVGAGVVMLRRRMSADSGRDRWLAVTVNRGPDEVAPDGKLPEPLHRLGDKIETKVRPAPNAKGTEIMARPRQDGPTGVQEAAARAGGDDPRQEIRRALREAKSLLETGEVLRPTTPGSDHPTLPGKLLDTVISRSAGEGRL
jgi:hypothetical protein